MIKVSLEIVRCFVPACYLNLKDEEKNSGWIPDTYALDGTIFADFQNPRAILMWWNAATKTWECSAARVPK